jgi:hypothetical protein
MSLKFDPDWKDRFYTTILHGQLVVVERLPPGNARGVDAPEPEEKTDPLPPPPTDIDFSRRSNRVGFTPKGQKDLLDEIRHTRGSWASGWKPQQPKEKQ